jgi:hypothetical protein
MASITEDSTRNEEYYSCGTEMKKGKSTIDIKQFDQYVIPVINNRCRLLENQKGYENVSFDREHQRTYGKVAVGKKKSTRNGGRVIILGDTHARGMANELQHRLGKSFEVHGIVKPGANIKEITNMLNSTVSSLTKKKMCVLCGRDLRYSKKLR